MSKHPDGDKEYSMLAFPSECSLETRPNRHTPQIVVDEAQSEPIKSKAHKLFNNER